MWTLHVAIEKEAPHATCLITPNHGETFTKLIMQFLISLFCFSWYLEIQMLSLYIKLERVWVLWSEIHYGSRVHGCICPRLKNQILNYWKLSKYSRIHIHILCVHKFVLRKSDIFYGMCKKIKKCLQRRLILPSNFVVLHKPQNISVFREMTL